MATNSIHARAIARTAYRVRKYKRFKVSVKSDNTWTNDEIISTVLLFGFLVVWCAAILGH
jgi:hypothetical protein